MTRRRDTAVLRSAIAETTARLNDLMRSAEAAGLSVRLLASNLPDESPAVAVDLEPADKLKTEKKP